MTQDATTVHTRVGPVPVRTVGTGGPVVLAVHGALVDSRLWDGVARALRAEATVLLPDLPLGAHRTAVPDRARLTPPDLAGALVDVLDGLGHARATVVGSDTGGALTQIAVAAHPERFEALVLTSCDAFEHFPPPLLAWLPAVARAPGVTRGVARVFALAPFLSRPGPLNLLTMRPVDPALVRSWMRPTLSDDGVRDDLTALLRGMGPHHTLRAAEALRDYPGPAVIAWSRRERIFPRRDAERLVATLPNATLQWIEGALTFSPLDQPEAVASAVRTAVSRVAAR